MGFATYFKWFTWSACGRDYEYMGYSSRILMFLSDKYLISQTELAQFFSVYQVKYNFSRKTSSIIDNVHYNN